MHRFVYLPLAVAALCLLLANSATAELITWAGGTDDDWHNFRNWNLITGPPILWRVPTDGDTVTLSDTTHGDVVILSDHTDQIDGLTVENGFRLATEGFLLIVNQANSAVTMIDGTNSQIIVDAYSVNPNSRAFDTDVLAILNGGQLWMNAGLAHIDVDGYISNSSEIHGSGEVQFNANSGTALVNDGTIRVSGVGDATLTIEAPSGAELDLDGLLFEEDEWGVLNANDGTGILSGDKTLIIDAPLADEFSSDIFIGQGDTIDFRQVWNQDGGTIHFYGGGHTASARIKSTTMSANNTTFNIHSGIAVLDTDSFLASNTTIDVDATLQVEGSVTLFSTSDLDLNDADALIVNGSLAVNQSVIDLGGDSAGDNTIRVGTGGTLALNVNSIDDDGIPDQFDGTMEIYGTLNANVDGGWTNNGTVHLYGGQLNGTAVTNTSVIRGHGSINTDGLDNEGTISADGGTLVLDSPGDDMDLDDDSILNAVDGNLEIREGNVRFQGTTNIGPSHSLYVDGNLWLDDGRYGPGVTHITGGTIEVAGQFTQSGTMLVDGAPSRIVAGETWRAISFESDYITINTDLTLDSRYSEIVNRTISGTGRLINADGARMLLGLSDIYMPVRNEGVLSPGVQGDAIHYFPGPSRVDRYEQTETGHLKMSIFDLDTFDQLLVDGTATLDGVLAIMLLDYDPEDSFMPSVGDSWEILTAANIDGEFTAIDDSDAMLPAGRFWDLVYNPTKVILRVIGEYAADFDFDGDVDGYDFLAWQRGESPNPLSAEDLALWEEQFGSEASSAAASTGVPEPASEILLMLGMAAVLFRRQSSSPGNRVNCLPNPAPKLP